MQMPLPPRYAEEIPCHQMLRLSVPPRYAPHHFARINFHFGEAVYNARPRQPADVAGAAIVGSADTRDAFADFTPANWLIFSHNRRRAA